MVRKKSLRNQVEDFAEQIGPVLTEAREKTAPHLAQAKEQFASTVVPAVSAALTEARENAEASVQEAQRRGLAAAAALKGEAPKKKRHRLRTLIVVGALAGAVAYVAKRMSESGAAPVPPPPPPTPRPAPQPIAVPDKPPAPAAEPEPAPEPEAVAEPEAESEPEPVVDSSVDPLTDESFGDRAKGTRVNDLEATGSFEPIKDIEDDKS